MAAHDCEQFWAQWVQDQKLFLRHHSESRTRAIDSLEGPKPVPMEVTFGALSQSAASIEALVVHGHPEQGSGWRCRIPATVILSHVLRWDDCIIVELIARKQPLALYKPHGVDVGCWLMALAAKER